MFTYPFRERAVLDPFLATFYSSLSLSDIKNSTVNQKYTCSSLSVNLNY